MYSDHDLLAEGLPHSDIHGSKGARPSPWLFAACHVLHRLLVPRHPPNALLSFNFLLLTMLRDALSIRIEQTRTTYPPCTGTNHQSSVVSRQLSEFASDNQSPTETFRKIPYRQHSMRCPRFSVRPDSDLAFARSSGRASQPQPSHHHASEHSYL